MKNIFRDLRTQSHPCGLDSLRDILQTPPVALSCVFIGRTSPDFSDPTEKIIAPSLTRITQILR